MTRLPPQPPDNLDQAEASILEPEVTAGDIVNAVLGRLDSNADLEGFAK